MPIDRRRPSEDSSPRVLPLWWRPEESETLRTGVLVNTAPTGVNFLVRSAHSLRLGDVVHTGVSQSARSMPALVRRVVRLPGDLLLIAATFQEGFARPALKAA